MARARAKVDAYNISWDTERGRDRIAYFRKMLGKVDDDPEKAKRLAQAECPLCYYEKSRIGAAVCTQVQCAFCDKKLSSGNSCVDKMCLACAVKAGLCKHCGADVNLKNRRKRELPVATETIDPRSF